MSIDSQINEIFEPLSSAIASVVFYSVPIGGDLGVKVILVWLVVASLFFTAYLGFINFRYFKHAVGLVFQKPGKKESGQISRFQALATSLSGTVGLGNIAGVAVAISVGGPGAAFWMMVMGFISMSTKFAEVTLGVKYRVHPDPNDPERISGGPMYYLRDGFAKHNMPLRGKILASFFALCAVLGTIGAASLFQTNQVYRQIINISGGGNSFAVGYGWVFGLFMAFLVGLVVIGGIKSIARVTSKIVPIMGLLYLVAGLVTIGIFYQNIPSALMTIFDSALNIKAGLGGVLGALLMGVQRAAFSNEAGFGTAAIAHSAVKTGDPVSQGFVGMLGPFIDTAIICSVTALVIVVSGAYEETGGMQGVELTSRAFEMGISWFPYVLFAVVFLFAYSTMISWIYYGVKAFGYLFGTNVLTDSLAKLIFLFFIIVGASSDLDSIILFTDSTVFLMTIPNIIGLYLLSPELKRDVAAYIKTLSTS